MLVVLLIVSIWAVALAVALALAVAARQGDRQLAGQTRHVRLPRPAVLCPTCMSVVEAPRAGEGCPVCAAHALSRPLAGYAISRN